MKVYKCDRCGKLVNSIDGIKDNLGKSPSIMVFRNNKEEYSDICNECYRDFRTWMDIGNCITQDKTP